ncbi:hypothetical protein CICLE_v10017479mg [Citrus x clementina]|uniref:Uncharacterized protein n=1 Tax=Citrus clementina TaxID=85681 RepID=V4VZY2_CITCL|nr:hypothetical protein CICLE_v10017479mg [Citrus x clementina]
MGEDGQNSGPMQEDLVQLISVLTFAVCTISQAHNDKNLMIQLILEKASSPPLVESTTLHGPIYYEDQVDLICKCVSYPQLILATKKSNVSTYFFLNF